MKIRVLQEDIDNGVARYCTTCPIALALQRDFAIPDVELVPNQPARALLGVLIVLCKKDGWDKDNRNIRAFRATTPFRAHKFIAALDRGELDSQDCQPFEMEVEFQVYGEGEHKST